MTFNAIGALRVNDLYYEIQFEITVIIKKISIKFLRLYLVQQKLH